MKSAVTLYYKNKLRILKHCNNDQEAVRWIQDNENKYNGSLGVITIKKGV